MFPWILGLGALAGLWAFSSSAPKSSVLPAPPMPAPRPASHPHHASSHITHFAPSLIPTHLTPAKPAPPQVNRKNILAAYHYAMTHETNPTALMDFGNSLLALGGYPVEANALRLQGLRLVGASMINPFNIASHQ
jgi:hypothetical protein